MDKTQLSNNTYLHVPFCSEFRRPDFYAFGSIWDLVTKCQKNREQIFKCRAIGILESINGIFYVKDIYYGAINKKVMIKVSMIYLQQPLATTVKPQTIQLFGYLQWERMPIIYANIVQVLISPIGLRLREAMDSVVRHLATEACKIEDEI